MRVPSVSPPSLARRGRLVAGLLRSFMRAIKAQEKTLSKLTIVNDERIAHQKERFDNNEERMKSLKEEILKKTTKNQKIKRKNRKN